MRFFYAKKEQICRYCKTVINYGDEAVAKGWKAPNGAIIPLVYHTTCYIPGEEASFNKLWNDWKLGATPRRIRWKRGRKPIYVDEEQAKEVNKLKSLLNYHKRVRNEERIAEIEAQLEELELGKDRIGRLLSCYANT